MFFALGPRGQNGMEISLMFAAHTRSFGRKCLSLTLVRSGFLSAHRLSATWDEQQLMPVPACFDEYVAGVERSETCSCRVTCHLTTHNRIEKYEKKASPPRSRVYYPVRRDPTPFRVVSIVEFVVHTAHAQCESEGENTRAARYSRYPSEGGVHHRVQRAARGPRPALGTGSIGSVPWKLIHLLQVGSFCTILRIQNTHTFPPPCLEPRGTHRLPVKKGRRGRLWYLRFR